MKNHFFLFTLFFCGVALAQPETEVFLMDISLTENDVSIKNIRNASNRAGYDNQPSFYDNNTLIYAGTRDGATDIAALHIPSFEGWWMNLPTPGGEYSPIKIPNSQHLSAVRLDPDGLQRLYKYPVPDQASELLINDLQVAYYAYANEHAILASVLSENRLDLVLADLKSKKVDTLVLGSGRSIHKVPNKDAMSYTMTNEEGNMDVFQLDLADMESYFVCQLPIGVQDHIWLDDAKLLLGSGNKLFLYDLYGNGDWKQVADLSKEKITDISRLAISPDGSKLALAAMTSAKTVAQTVQSHIEPFNNRNLDAFAAVFSEDVQVNRYPEAQMYAGKASFKKNYADYYKRVKDVKVSVEKRIVIGNTVIDQEKVVKDGKTHRQATIYKVQNEQIQSMTFIADTRPANDPETIVQKQLDAYNNKDIDGFMATYSSDIKIFNFPETQIYGDKASMAKSYDQMFTSTPDLNAAIKTRIVIGNKVIDEEYVTMNGQKFSAVAIYEVTDGLISKVRFLR